MRAPADLYCYYPLTRAGLPEEVLNHSELFKLNKDDSMQNKTRYLALAALAAFATVAVADQVIPDDLIVQSSLCVGGTDCTDGEDFKFDTLRIKSANPVIRFTDTSNSGSFPTNDWLMGSTGEATRFFIEDAETATTVLQISLAGDIALGAGSALEEGAISVGDIGNERRIMHVADAVDETDAVNLRQFEAFRQDALDSIGAQDAEYQADLDAVQQRIDALADRIDALADRIESAQ